MGLGFNQPLDKGVVKGMSELANALVSFGCVFVIGGIVVGAAVVAPPWAKRRSIPINKRGLIEGIVLIVIGIALEVTAIAL